MILRFDHDDKIAKNPFEFEFLDHQVHSDVICIVIDENNDISFAL